MIMILITFKFITSCDDTIQVSASFELSNKCSFEKAPSHFYQGDNFNNIYDQGGAFSR